MKSEIDWNKTLGPLCLWLNEHTGESLYMWAEMSSVLQQHTLWDTQTGNYTTNTKGIKEKKGFLKIVRNMYKWPQMKSGTINMGKECKTMYNKSREICITIHNDKKIGSKQDSIVERQHELKSTFFKMTFFPGD